jgi:hypothetical protein
MGIDGQHHAPAALPPGNRAGTNRTGGLVSHRVGLDGCRKTHPQRDSTPGPSSPERVAVLTTSENTYFKEISGKYAKQIKATNA